MRCIITDVKVPTYQPNHVVHLQVAVKHSMHVCTYLIVDKHVFFLLKKTQKFIYKTKEFYMNMTSFSLTSTSYAVKDEQKRHSQAYIQKL